jgi:hypothetical protein
MFQEPSTHGSRLLWAAASVLLLAPAGVEAQTAVGSFRSSEPTTIARSTASGPEWGGANLSVAVVTAFDCSTFFQSDTWSPVPGTPNRYLTSGSSVFECPVSLPTGAVVSRIELEACDTSPSGEIAAAFATTTEPGGGGTTLAEVSSGDPFADGCDWFALDIPPETIANRPQKYFFQIDQTTTDGSTAFAAVRAYYRLQVSPAPPTATFGDVPTGSAYFRFVEALAASGITGGCGGGDFCPDSPLTRAQMAVFLATALGLHYPDE